MSAANAHGPKFGNYVDTRYTPGKAFKIIFDSSPVPCHNHWLSAAKIRHLSDSVAAQRLKQCPIVSDLINKIKALAGPQDCSEPFEIRLRGKLERKKI